MDLDGQYENFKNGPKAVLREWSAQDFSNIYTRFRPHLERHAWKFLKNQSEVDDVVQDAFLYLMVTLPELDSELGVLRFLKWKVRLLCLDLSRASGRVELSSIDSHAEFDSGDPEISTSLERADDAAVVRLALSKLNPRHREVLIAAMYEEKSSAQIAAQVGLSENGTNQLIFRARAAFKKALLGEDVDTSGMSVSKILSVAARKAASEAKNAGAQAMVFVLFLTLSLGAFIAFNDVSTQIRNEATNSSTLNPPDASLDKADPREIIEGEGVLEPLVENSEPEKAMNTAQLDHSVNTKTPWEPWEIEEIFISQEADISVFSRAQVPQSVTVKQSYSVGSSQGLVADFEFDSDAAAPFTRLFLTAQVAGQSYTAIPVQTDFLVESDDNGVERFIFIGSFDRIMDENDKELEFGRISSGQLRLEILIEHLTGLIIGSNLQISGD